MPKSAWDILNNANKGNLEDLQEALDEAQEEVIGASGEIDDLIKEASEINHNFHDNTISELGDFIAELVGTLEDINRKLY